MSNFIFLNDKIIEEREGLLSAQDRGFLYGDGLFETLRTYGKTPFRLEDHVARLSTSARYFGIPFCYTPRQVQQIVEQLISKNNLEDAYIRMTLSRGVGVNGLVPRGECTPTFVVHAKPFVSYPALLYETGACLVTSSIRRSVTCPVSRHKTLNFLTNYLIKKEAAERGAFDALVLNTDNHVAECAVSNIFIVGKGVVITPALKVNVLPGITRKVILELCKENDMPVREELFGIDRVFGADEVFMTNSLMEIMPVSRIDEHVTSVGAVTKLLHEKYRALTAF